MDQLFSRETTAAYVYRLRYELTGAVDRLDETAFDTMTDDQIIEDLIARRAPRPVALKRDQERIEGPEHVQIDVSHNFSYAPMAGGGPRLVAGARFTLVIPFDGSADLFDLRPSTYTLTVPTGDVVGDCLRFMVDEFNPDAASLKSRFAGLVQDVQQWIECVNADVVRELDAWRREVIPRVAARRAQIASYRRVADDLRGGLTS